MKKVGVNEIIKAKLEDSDGILISKTQDKLSRIRGMDKTAVINAVFYFDLTRNVSIWVFFEALLCLIHRNFTTLKQK